jgi:ABC-type transporter Mla maintaining outer membrane lipid asymmetry ATPase subunit MlaF
MGSVKTGVILKDVSLEVHGGEVLAILGSKGDDITMCTDQLQYYIYNFSFLIHEL